MSGDRPYMAMSIEDLTSTVRNASSRMLLDEVANELSHRKTHRARRLAQEIEGLQAGERPAQRKAREDTRSSDTAPLATSIEDDALTVRYNALRATFTAEAEILARWGLTALAPHDLRIEAISHWRQALHEDPEAHPLGLSIDDLERDLQALADEHRDV